MIFIGGISPKTAVVDPTARLCPVCGLARARLQRVDHWLSLFFIPVIRVKKGEPFLFCNRCDRPITGPLTSRTGPDVEPDICVNCKRILKKDHRFCPYCGTPRR